MKPVVAVGAIDMESKIPGSKTYKPPQSETFYRPAEDRGGTGGQETDDEVAARERELAQFGGIQMTKIQREVSRSYSSSLITLPMLTLFLLLFQVSEIVSTREQLLEDDDYVTTHQPPNYEKFLKDRTIKEDTGAGNCTLFFTLL